MASPSLLSSPSTPGLLLHHHHHHHPAESSQSDAMDNGSTISGRIASTHTLGIPQTPPPRISHSPSSSDDDLQPIIHESESDIEKRDGPIVRGDIDAPIPIGLGLLPKVSNSSLSSSSSNEIDVGRQRIASPERDPVVPSAYLIPAKPKSVCVP